MNLILPRPSPLGRGVLALGLALAACAAQADTLLIAGPTGPMETDRSLSVSVNAAAGAGLVALQLQGYATLDGDNFWIDVFHLAVNGMEAFTGTWDLGGGGGGPLEGVILGAPGATAVRAGPQVIDITVPVTFQAGANTLTFSYESPLTYGGIARAGFQGQGDEAWGLNSTVITGAVPEPSSWALVLGGLVVASALARSGKRMRQR